MSYLKRIIKKILKKVFSPLLRKFELINELQKENLNKNLNLEKRSAELNTSMNNIMGLIEKMDENYSEVSKSIEDMKNSRELQNKVDSLINYIDDIKKENSYLKNYIENMSLTLNRKSSIRKIRIIFLVHNVESWYSTQPIYESMLRDCIFDPIIISLPRNYNSHDGTFEDKATEYLKSKYENVISFEDYNSIPNDILYILNPDIIFRQSPWDDDIPEVFRTNNTKMFKVCYLPYAVNSLPLSELSLNQSLYRYAWRIYCQSEFDRESYKKHNLIGDSNALVSGYAKFEQMNQELFIENKDLIWPIKRKRDASLKILWAPHHSLEGWFGFTTFNIIYEDMYNFAANNPDIEIVLRPHPALTEVMSNSGLIEKEKLKEYYEKFNNLENAYIDFDAEYINLFKHSDILVSDGVSFLFEYIITGKPIIHTDSKKHIEFNEFGKQFESCWYKAYSFNDLQEHILRIKNGEDKLLEQRLLLKDRLFDFTEDNKPSKIIINDIKNSLLND